MTKRGQWDNATAVFTEATALLASVNFAQYRIPYAVRASHSERAAEKRVDPKKPGARER